LFRQAGDDVGRQVFDADFEQEFHIQLFFSLLDFFVRPRLIVAGIIIKLYSKAGGQAKAGPPALVDALLSGMLLSYFQDNHFMLLISDILVTSEVLEAFFRCEPERCRGACCATGEGPVPLLPEETEILAAAQVRLEGCLDEAGRALLARAGTSILYGNRLSAPLLDNGACAYAVTRSGIVSCGIQAAAIPGFPKPVSCHLYPIRERFRAPYRVLFFDRWNICRPALESGRRTGTRLVDFLEAALIRRFGCDFYRRLRDRLAGKESGC